MKKTIAQQVLEFIKAAGHKGRRYGEIQRLIVEDYWHHYIDNEWHEEDGLTSEQHERIGRF